MMTELQRRLEVLQQEAQKCHASAEDLNRSLAEVQRQSLRIDGALQIVRELLAEAQKSNGDPGAPPSS